MDSTTAEMTGANHVSLTIEMGFSFPIAPAGMVIVCRVPVQSTPSMFRDPRSSFDYLPFLVWNHGGKRIA